MLKPGRSLRSRAHRNRRVRERFSSTSAVVFFGAFLVALFVTGQQPRARAASSDAGAVAVPRPAIDLLFVIDNSGSMADKQANLRAHFANLLFTFQQSLGGTPDLHIAIVTTDVGAGNVPLSNNPACNQHGGDQAKFHIGNNCGLINPNSHFLVSLNNETLNNYSGKLEDVFACTATVGTSGCGFVHPLQAARLALAANFNTENADFLRDDAFLAVVFVTDEDDCSAPPVTNLFSDNTSFDPNALAPKARCYIAGVDCNGQPVPRGPSMFPLASCAADPQQEPPGAEQLYPVSEFADFFKQLKPVDKLLMAGIIGWPRGDVSGSTWGIGPSSMVNGHTLNDIQPVCDGGGANGKGWPGVRMKTFLDSFPNSQTQSICDNDFGPAFSQLGSRLADMVLAAGGVPDGGLFPESVDANGSMGSSNGDGSSLNPGQGDSGTPPDAAALDGSSVAGDKGSHVGPDASGVGVDGTSSASGGSAPDGSGCSCTLGTTDGGSTSAGVCFGVALAAACIARRRARRR